MNKQINPIYEGMNLRVSKEELTRYHKINARLNLELIGAEKKKRKYA